jgi:small subunit ribosomal protein S12
MTTYNQYIRITRFTKKYHKWKRRALAKSPQKIAKCQFVGKISPKKPCSAKRSVALVKIRSGILAYCYIPGIGHDLRMREEVFVCGGRRNDLPGVKYRIIRGPKFVLSILKQKVGKPPRISSRSVYGLKKLITDDELKEREIRDNVKRNKKNFKYKFFKRCSRAKLKIKLLTKNNYFVYLNKPFIYYYKFAFYGCL